MATTETIMNMIRRFSTDHRADLQEAIRRVVADVLVGNGDNHLKNWSFIFPKSGEIRLSPAYDIVPTIMFILGDNLGLKFAGTQAFENVSLHRFERVAKYLGLDPRWIVREVKSTVAQAMDLWPAAVGDLFDEKRAAMLIDRLPTLQLVREISAPATAA